MERNYRKKYISSLLIIGLFINSAFGQNLLSKSDFIKVDFDRLAINKAKLLSNDKSLLPAYNQLIKDAKKALKYLPVSVMDKTDVPPSGNKHDYMSIGPYWWPNPNKPGGVPYIKKDGEVNPEVRNYPDKENLPKLCENLYTLTLAYYYSKEEKYADHASKLLSVWFLDTATCMNPNLKFGQAVKGVNEGRAEGLIETRHFVYMIDAIKMLEGSKSWSKANNDQMKVWFSKFLNWLNTSDIGKKEMNAKNNHGVWFDAQSLSLALFVDSTQMANQIVVRALDRLDKQMDNDGFFPLELERTTALHYSVFILNAFELIADLSTQTNTNFWTAQTKSGKTFKKAIEAMMPYMTNEKKWTGKQIKEYDYSDGYTLMLRAYYHYDCKDCIEAIKKLIKEDTAKHLFNLL